MNVDKVSLTEVNWETTWCTIQERDPSNVISALKVRNFLCLCIFLLRKQAYRYARSFKSCYESHIIICFLEICMRILRVLLLRVRESVFALPPIKQKIFYNRSTNSALCTTLNVFIAPLPFYATQIISPFLTSRISANHDKGLVF